MRRFARAASVEDVLAITRDGRPSILDPFRQHLHDRWNDGVHSAAQLFTEICAWGYPGCYTTVRAYLQPFRALHAAPPPLTLRPPKVRELTAWLMRHPDSRSPEQQIRLKQALANCAHLAATSTDVTAFAEMMTNLHGEHLDIWIDQVRADDLPQLHSFAAGLQRDRAAVNQRTHPAAQLRHGRRQRQPHQDDQAPDVWPRKLQPAPQTSPTQPASTA